MNLFVYVSILGAGKQTGPQLPGASGIPRGPTREREMAAADVVQIDEPQFSQL